MDREFEFVPAPTPPLTDAEIDKVLAELDRMEVSPEHLEQRRHPRLPYGCPVSVVCEAGDWAGDAVRFTARCRDLSEGGLSMLSPLPIKPGTRCVLTLVTADHQTAALTGVVRNAANLQDDLLLCGIAFDEPITLEQFLPRRKAG